VWAVISKFGGRFWGFLMFAVDACRLPQTGGSTFVLIAGVFLLVAGVIVARWVRQSAGRLSVVVAPLVLLGGFVLVPQVTDPCAPATTTVPSATTTVPSATTTVPSATTTTTTITTTTTLAPVVYQVGQTGPGGGTVFYKHASGTFACGATLNQNCTYLEVAPNTWSGGSADPQNLLWAVSTYQSGDVPSITNDSSAYYNASGIGLGYKNSLAIVAQGNDTTTAAGAARAYGGGSQSDWYLPSTAELNLLCQWARNVPQSVTTPCTGGTLNTGTGLGGGFSTFIYWSSSEFGAYFAWEKNFTTGDQYGYHKSAGAYVRPVRAF
jgi:hypothetical protein